MKIKKVRDHTKDTKSTEIDKILSEGASLALLYQIIYGHKASAVQLRTFYLRHIVDNPELTEYKANGTIMIGRNKKKNGSVLSRSLSERANGILYK